MTIARAACWTGGTLLLLMNVTGCEHPGVQKQLAGEQRSFNHMVNVLKELEEGRDQKIARSLRFAEGNERRAGQKCQRDLNTLELWMKEESDRWAQRQPAYRRGIQDLLKGDPANFDRTWPMVLY